MDKATILLTKSIDMKHLYLALLPLIALATACNSNVFDKSPGQRDVNQVRFRLTEYDGDALETRTTYNTGESTFYWAEGDIVGIVSPEGNQLKFPIKPDYYGQAYALFDGRGFALLEGNTYSSYYPFVPDFDLNPAALPISYEGQRQNGDNSLAGLGAYSFTAAIGSAPDEGSLDFIFRNIGSPHRYRMPVPAGNYTGLTLVIPSAKYILSGTINLLASTEESIISITPTAMTDRLSLDLRGASMADTGQLRCWMMLPPVNLDGDAIRMELTAEDGSTLLASVAGRDCPANSRRVFNALTSVTPGIQDVVNEGGNIEVRLIRSAASDEVSVTPLVDWIAEGSSSTDGLVTTYTFAVAANAGAAREGQIAFTETSTGLINSVSVLQNKAGAIIGIGGWDNDDHSGHAD